MTERDHTDGVVAVGDAELAAHLGKLRVVERFVRKDFGHMDVHITIDDPGAYTRPWDVTLPLALAPDTELLEYICNENNKYFEIIPKAGTK